MNLHWFWLAESGSALGMRIQIQQGKKEEKIQKFQVSKCCTFYFEAEGFSGSLDTMESLYEGLSKFEFLIKTNI
jgi:hypothetical protein